MGRRDRVEGAATAATDGAGAADQTFVVASGSGPVVALALHDGHAVRREVAELLAIGDEERRREEDPFTAAWTALGDHRVVARRSRFEVDLNRPPAEAVYRTPEQSWGLEVWRRSPPAEVVERSMDVHRRFYARVGELFAELAAHHRRFVVYDLHSYNHRRGGPGAAPDDLAENPDVNLGTGSLDRRRWAPLVERFLADLSRHGRAGQRLDVRENVRFRGGGFAQWAHATFPASACVLAIEWKKTFMDEWTGEPDEAAIAAVREALAATLPGVREELERLGARR
ncbi:MAG TPA: N-formylglutamate amidohydrolase [Thermoanaerobaculia bacterium]|nr:N-formylglutamate amidohydrolase [Thermoanaerobaculia bacterium]